MARLKRTLTVLSSLAALSAAVYGVTSAAHSNLFLVRVVEVADQPELSPLDAREITALAAIPIGKVSLFALDLSEIERRIVHNPWVREVSIQKRFPQTVSISVSFREPRALFQAANGQLAYVDADGRPFGRANLMLHHDLPVLAGFASESPFRISEGLRLLEVWDKSPLKLLSLVSSLTWDEERGYRVLASYPLDSASTRVVIDLGQEIDTHWEEESLRLSEVFKYLKGHSIAAHQIWADAGKKIVVKTARGS